MHFLAKPELATFEELQNAIEALVYDYHNPIYERHKQEILNAITDYRGQIIVRFSDRTK